MKAKIHENGAGEFTVELYFGDVDGWVKFLDIFLSENEAKDAISYLEKRHRNSARRREIKRTIEIDIPSKEEIERKNNFHKNIGW